MSVIKQVLTSAILIFFALSTYPQSKKTGRKVIFKEFDGKSENGDWRKQYGFEYQPECDWNRWYFEVRKSCGKMYFDGGNDSCRGAGNNQHVVRFDKTIDPRKPYTIECDFIVDTAFVTEINSFCVNFNVQKGVSKENPLNAWSINLDINSKQKGNYAVKNMGFADIENGVGNMEYGRFTELLPQHTGIGALPSPHVNRLKIQVNRAIDGAVKFKHVTVTRSDETGIKDFFEIDYGRFPYQPDFDKPVKVGLNTHGTNWIIKNLIVYY